MAHIHTDPGQHDFTASAYIVRTDLPEPAVLMHNHRLLRQWLQFGGHIELHEDPWEAVKHEVKEESGYDLRQLKLLQPDIRQPELTKAKCHPWPANIATFQFGDLDHYHTDMAYAFTTAEDPAHKVGDDESQEFRTFTATQLKALGGDKIPENVREMALLILSDYSKNWKQVALD